jgi:hypothetical protein
MVTTLLLAVTTACALALGASDFEKDSRSDETAPTVIALEIGRLGDDTRGDPRARRLGDSERVFGPIHPSSRSHLGSYTGNGLGSYTGGGLGSYTGSGLGGTTTMGTGNASGGRIADDRVR